MVGISRAPVSSFFRFHSSRIFLWAPARLFCSFHIGRTFCLSTFQGNVCSRSGEMCAWKKFHFFKRNFTLVLLYAMHTLCIMEKVKAAKNMFQWSESCVLVQAKKKEAIYCLLEAFIRRETMAKFLVRLKLECNVGSSMVPIHLPPTHFLRTAIFG